MVRACVRRHAGPALGPRWAHARPLSSCILSSDPKQRITRLYDSVAAEYAEKGPPFFDHAGRRLVEIAGVAEGQQVLDVATGRGAVLFPAVGRVGPTGFVTGIDLAESMVTHTAREIARRGVTTAAVRVMDAEALECPAGSFDRVLCSFAVFFLTDLRAVLAGMFRVLKPGGVVGFAFIRGKDDRWRWYEALLKEHGAFDDYPPRPGVPGILKENRLVEFLIRAGFTDGVETRESVDLDLGDEHTWWQSLWTNGSRAALERLPEPTLEIVRTEALARACALKTEAGLLERHDFVYVTAVRP